MQTEAQRRYGQRRTLAERLDRAGWSQAARLIRERKIEIPNPNIQENK